MERVSANRDLPLVGCMVSSPVYDVGTWVVVYGRNTDRAMRCRVTDVSHPRDKKRHIETRRVTELSYQAALVLCGKEHIKDPPTKCPVMVFRFKGQQ